MKTTLTANEVGGRATGVLFFTGFGALWLLLSLYAREDFTASTVAGVLLGALALGCNAIYLLRQARRLRRVPEDPRIGRVFGWINAIQWTAGFAVAFTLAKLHMDVYIPSAITAIVGLHMFPLARLFRYPLHHVTGTLLVAWAAVSALAVPADRLQGIAALGTGVILWVSATVTLGLALQIVRKPARQLA